MGFTRKVRVGYSCTRDSISTYQFCNIYLMIIFKLRRLWASWPGFVGRVGRLKVGPLFLPFESIRRGTHGNKPIMKFMVMPSHFQFGMLSGCNSPLGFILSDLDLLRGVTL
jgi:hypothetical protein